MTQEEFLLKWNDHHASFFTIVEDLCRTEQLCDVTLACGGQVFETHKLILSVCSPYFRTLLNSRPDKHPIVYLKDVNPKHLEQLLSYMYRGEINVLQEDLGPLIETARGLQIKGLADAGNSDNSNNSRKEPKSISNGLPSHPLPQLNQPKRSRTSTPTPAPKMARLALQDTPRLPQVPAPVISPPTHRHNQYEDSGSPIAEVDPTEGGGGVKQEMWMMGTGGGENEDDGDGYDGIPPEQYEQDMQAEDEQYIQAGNEGLTGQQLAVPTPRARGQYHLQDMAKAYDDCTSRPMDPGDSLAKVARKYNVPRKTLENYVTGRTSIQTLYKKLGATSSYYTNSFNQYSSDLCDTYEDSYAEITLN